MGLFISDRMSTTDRLEHLNFLTEGEYLVQHILHNLGFIMKNGRKAQDPIFDSLGHLDESLATQQRDLASALLEFNGLKHLLSKKSVSPITSSRVSSPKREALPSMHSRQSSTFSTRKSVSYSRGTSFKQRRESMFGVNLQSQQSLNLGGLTSKQYRNQEDSIKEVA